MHVSTDYDNSCKILSNASSLLYSACSFWGERNIGMKHLMLNQISLIKNAFWLSTSTVHCLIGSVWCYYKNPTLKGPKCPHRYDSNVWPCGDTYLFICGTHEENSLKLYRIKKELEQ